MILPAALKRHFVRALNHAVPRAAPRPPVIAPVPRPAFPVPPPARACSRACYFRGVEIAKPLNARLYRAKSACDGVTKNFVFPVIGAITGKAAAPARVDDSFVTHLSGCRHRANRIAKRLLRRGYFAAT